MSETDRNGTTDPTLDVVGACAVGLADAIWEVQGRDRSDAAALGLIHDRPGISIEEVARQVGLTHSATVRLVDRLEEASLARRSAVGPGRRVGLSLTGKGGKAVSSSRRARHAVLSLAIRELDAESVRLLKELARRIVTNIADDQPEIDRACRLCNQLACFAVGCPLPASTQRRVARPRGARNAPGATASERRSGG